MGYLKDIHSNLDIQAFPGAHFEIVGDVPASQCSEAKIESVWGETNLGGNHVFEPGKFTGWNLVGKICHITHPPANAGDYTILFNDTSNIQCQGAVFVGAGDNNYFITDGGELILTRNAPSFATYIHAAGYAYTIKGGKLYTNMPSDQLQNACSILFDPLT